MDAVSYLLNQDLKRNTLSFAMLNPRLYTAISHKKQRFSTIPILILNHFIDPYAGRYQYW
jgi:hypothetical protein